MWNRFEIGRQRNGNRRFLINLPSFFDRSVLFLGLLASDQTQPDFEHTPFEQMEPWLFHRWMSIGSPRAIIDISFRCIFPWRYLVVRVARESIYIVRRRISRAWRPLTREIEPCDFVPNDGRLPSRESTPSRKRGILRMKDIAIFDYWIRDIVWITKRNEINRIDVWK